MRLKREPLRIDQMRPESAMRDRSHLTTLEQRQQLVTVGPNDRADVVNAGAAQGVNNALQHAHSVYLQRRLGNASHSPAKASRQDGGG